MRLSNELSTVRDARRFLRRVLHGWGAEGYEYGAAQVLTELATNAALHAASPYTVDLRLEPEGLLIEVTDDSPRPPRQRHYSIDATTGRGIGLVAALSVDWGTTARHAGKTVWARVVADEMIDITTDLDEVVDPAPVVGSSRVARRYSRTVDATAA